MLLPNGLFCCPFTSVDSAGAPLAPAQLPTGVLVKNGTDTSVPVTITMSGAQGIASCSIPGNAIPGDCWHMRVTSAGYTLSGPVFTTGPAVLTSAYDAAKTAAAPGQAMTLTPAERSTLAGTIETELLNDQTGGAFLAGLQSQIQAILDSNTDVPVATLSNAIAAAVRSNLATELARLDVAVGTRLASDEFVAAPTTDEIAGAILQHPEHRILTSVGGMVAAPSGGQNGVTGPAFVLPLRSTPLERMVQNRIDLFTREQFPLVIPIYDENRQPVDCTGLECTLHVTGGIEVPGLLPAPSTQGGVLHQYQFVPPTELTATPASLRFSLRVSNATRHVLAYGQIVVAETP